jgi:YVTN family beta-propeller protein
VSSSIQHRTRTGAGLLLGLSALLPLAGCKGNKFPNYPASYREFAYVSDGAANTVTVLDLVYLRLDRTLQVGRQPTGLGVNPVRDEVYAVNTGSDSVSVIDSAANKVVATIGVHHTPYFIAVAPDGKHAYVPNSGSNTVSVLDLDKRREINVTATGEGPGVARVAPDNRSLVVSNRVAGSISIYSITTSATNPLEFRSTFSGCAGATDIAILPDSSKAFIACSGSHQVMVVWLAAAPDSWNGTQDSTLQHDQLLALLDVGKTPTSLALEPSGNDVFSMNFDSDSISDISTWTNEVLSTSLIGSKPVRGIVSSDTSLAPPGSLWVSDFGSDSASMYSTDDGHVEDSIHTGSHPDAMAFSADQHLLLTTDSASADIAVIRTQSRTGPALVTLLPAGNQPNDIVVKSFQVDRKGEPKTN